jgi:hypothetical protein
LRLGCLFQCPHPALLKQSIVQLLHLLYLDRMCPFLRRFPAGKETLRFLCGPALPPPAKKFPLTAKWIAVGRWRRRAAGHGRAGLLGLWRFDPTILRHSLLSPGIAFTLHPGN